MPAEFDSPQSKTAGDLGREAISFIIHTLLAVLFLALVVFGIGLTNPDPDAALPKIIGTILAFLVPMIAGFVIVRIQPAHEAKHVWVSGLVFFALVCVWVLDLPTGNGRCEACADDPIQKLQRTFFSIHNGSGLMNGDGLLVGTWIPLAMIGYAIGAAFAFDD